MQRTTDRLVIRVGEDQTMIALTDSAVVAVQDDAAGQAHEHLEALGRTWSDLTGDVADFDLAELLDLRASAQSLVNAFDVLIECRPLDELEHDDD